MTDEPEHLESKPVTREQRRFQRLSLAVYGILFAFIASQFLESFETEYYELWSISLFWTAWIFAMLSTPKSQHRLSQFRFQSRLGVIAYGVVTILIVVHLLSLDATTPSGIASMVASLAVMWIAFVIARRSMARWRQDQQAGRDSRDRDL